MLSQFRVGALWLSEVNERQDVKFFLNLNFTQKKRFASSGVNEIPQGSRVGCSTEGYDLLGDFS